MFDELRIDEASRRWPDFQGGRPIELPDGQTWWFHEPAAMTRGGLPGWTFGESVPHDIDAILSGRFGRIASKWGLATDGNERASAIVEAAWFLLARNYAVTADEFERIVANASAWEDQKQRALGAHLFLLVGAACSRASAFQGTA